MTQTIDNLYQSIQSDLPNDYTVDDFVITLTDQINTHVQKHFKQFKHELLDIVQGEVQPMIAFNVTVLDQIYPIRIQYQPNTDSHKLNQSIIIKKFNHHRTHVQVYSY